MDTRWSEEQANAPVFLPGGVPSALPTGCAAVRGQGGYCWDQHGQRYLDFVCGYGAVILGHGDRAISHAVGEQLGHGLLLPGPSPLYTELTGRLCGTFPNADMCVITKTGSEAVAAAIRLARAHTRRKMIIRCGFHGWHDQFLDSYKAWHCYEVDPKPPERVDGVARRESLVLSWSGEDLNQLDDLLVRHDGEVAAVILDPVQIREPVAEHLRELRSMTRTHGALLILDEAKTGMRVGLAGVEGRYKIGSDLCILGKSLANGLPLSGVVGNAEVLRTVRSTRIMGTFNKELGAIVAALVTLDRLAETDTLHRISQLGQRLIDGVNDLLRNHGLASRVLAVPYRWPCMPFLWFRDPTTRRWQDEFYSTLARRGTLLLPRHMSFVCGAHTSTDIEEALLAIDGTLRDLSHLIGAR